MQILVSYREDLQILRLFLHFLFDATNLNLLRQLLNLTIYFLTLYFEDTF